MLVSVETTIRNLRGAVSAKSDAELARTLRIDQSTISSWRTRGKVPEKFVKLVRSGFESDLKAPEQNLSQLEVWPELAECAQAVALVRFTLLRQDVARSGDVDRAISVFIDRTPYWLVLYRAVYELRQKMDALGVELKTAQVLILQDDLRDPDATAQRLAKHLAEDIANNPTFKM